MADGKNILPDADTLSMTRDAADKLIAAGNGDAALLYVYVLSSGGVFSRDEAAAKLRRAPEQIDLALSALARMGLVRRDAVPAKSAPLPADELPQYTAADIKRELDSGAVFRELTQNVQSALGKLLSSDDLIKLFGIYDYLGLPPEVILLLVNHCIDECARRYGPSRRPTMRYVEKAAYEWEREGIFSLDAAEAYLLRMEKTDAATDKFAGALQIRGRNLTASERRYITEWITMGFPPDAAAEAYDRTVLKTGKMAWGYMNSIMKSWHEKGLHTIEEIERGDRKPAPARRKAVPAGTRPTAADIDRNRKALEQLKKEG